MKATLLICLIHLLAGSQAQSRLNCATRGGGECVLQRKCSQLASTNDFRLLRSKICGFQGRNPMVCCNSGSTGTVTPRTDSPTRPPPGRGNVFPKICGLGSTDDKIIGGGPAKIGSYPWMAVLAYTERRRQGVKYDCAGTLISSRYVLTAAHCTDPKYLKRRKLSHVILGEHDLKQDHDCQTLKKRKRVICSPGTLIAGVEEVIQHPQFDTVTRFGNDIALIRLNISLTFKLALKDPWVRPVCVAPRGLNIARTVGGRNATAAGWGFTETGASSSILLRVGLPLADTAKCVARYKDQFVPESQLCIGGTKGKDTCSGDSGGPLVIYGLDGPPSVMFGIVSYGPFPCGIPGVPGVYTNVAFYRNWIDQNMKP